MKLEEAKDRMLNRNNNNTVWLELGTQQLLASVFIDSRTVVVLCLLFLFLRKIILFVNSKALIDNSVWLYIVAGGSIFFGGKIHIICVVTTNDTMSGKVRGVAHYTR